MNKTLLSVCMVIVTLCLICLTISQVLSSRYLFSWEEGGQLMRFNRYTGELKVYGSSGVVTFDFVKLP